MTTLLKRLRAELVEVADPGRAPAMQAYMKSEMPFHGVASALLKATCKRVFAGLALADAASWRGEVLGLWRGARFREERYAAIQLSGDRRARAWQTPATLPMYRELIVTGAWWDFVDEVAARRIGPLLVGFPDKLRPLLLRWSRGADIWLRRTSIICQLHVGAACDLELLYACIEPSLASKEFFLRKAIGWALRQLAYKQPDEVRRYVRAHRGELSGLSQREALKHLGPL